MADRRFPHDTLQKFFCIQLSQNKANNGVQNTSLKKTALISTIEPKVSTLAHPSTPHYLLAISRKFVSMIKI
jgi:hypothetical protein